MIATFTSIIRPFPYQFECLQAIELAEIEGKKAALVIMASGLGKTIVAALETQKRIQKKPDLRCLFLCHQNDILDQAQEDFHQVFGPTVEYGFFHSDKKSAHHAQIVFGSFQTMRGNLADFRPDEFDLIIVDETHHLWAPTYEKVVRYFTPGFLLGITATPDRLDELDIRDIYGNEVYNLSFVQALARELLAPVEYKLVTDEIGSLKKLETPTGRMSYASLNRLVFIPKRDYEIVEIIKSHMALISNPQVIIFCSSIEHCELISELLPSAVPLHSKVPKKERKLRLQMFRQGIFKIAVTVDMFNEALNIPGANLIVFLRMTSSPTVFFQQLGRGLRPHKNKVKVTILDFVANCERIAAVYELWKTIQREVKKAPNQPSDPVAKNIVEPFTLNVDSIEFKEKVIPIIELLHQFKSGFYLTWQEAGKKAQELGIETARQYGDRYREDMKLPSFPYKYYSDFPGWKMFLETEFYSTWKEASKAAEQLGIKSGEEYRSRYKEDKNLTSAPEWYYSDFPGWSIFLQKKQFNPYPTWKEASEMALSLKITSSAEYYVKYKEDIRLPSAPDLYYSDFPGWNIFLGKEVRESMYPTWQEASKAAKELGVNSYREYKNAYKNDLRLPSYPSSKYSDFPGWKKFLKQN